MTKPSGCSFDTMLYKAIENEIMLMGSDETVCHQCNVTDCPHNRKYENFIMVGFQEFRLVKTKDELPRTPEYCRTCQTMTAVPIAVIRFRSELGYALQCKMCKESYPVYKSSYDRKYRGAINIYGKYIPPTHGKRETMRSRLERESRAFESGVKRLMEEYGYTREEAVAMKTRWEEERREANARITREIEERNREYKLKEQEKQIKQRVEEKANGVKSGDIVWDKNNRCFVNVKTGQIVKL